MDESTPPVSVQRAPMPPLTAWILILTALPVAAALSSALLAIAQHPENENDRTAAAALAQVAPAVERDLDREGENLEELGGVIARDPKFYAILALRKPDRSAADYKSALEGVLRDFQRDAGASFFAVTDEKGAPQARPSAPSSGPTMDWAASSFVSAAMAGRASHGCIVEQGTAYEVAAVPITAGEVLVGTLTLGRSIQEEWARRLKGAIAADLVLTIDDAISVGTLQPSPLRKALAGRLEDLSHSGPGAAGDRPNVGLGFQVDALAADGGRYLVLRRSTRQACAGGKLGYVLLRPLEREPSPLEEIRNELLYAGGLGLVLALLCGAAVILIVRFAQRRSGEERAEETERLIAAQRSRSELLAAVAAILRGSVSREDLAQLGEDLSDLALLERRELGLALGPVDLGELVARASAEILPIASLQHQTVSLETERGLLLGQSDEAYLLKAIRNLGISAIRSSGKRGVVRLGACREGERARLSVTATPGLAPVPSEEGASHPVQKDLSLTAAVGILKALGGEVHLPDENGEHGWSCSAEFQLSQAAQPPQFQTEEAIPLARGTASTSRQAARTPAVK